MQTISHLHDLTQALEGLIKDQLSPVVNAAHTVKEDRKAFESNQQHLRKVMDDITQSFSLTDAELRAFKNSVTHCNTDSSIVAGTIARYAILSLICHSCASQVCSKIDILETLLAHARDCAVDAPSCLTTTYYS
jgi:hypothetical protein